MVQKGRTYDADAVLTMGLAVGAAEPKSGTDTFLPFSTTERFLPWTAAAKQGCQ